MPDTTIAESTVTVWVAEADDATPLSVALTVKVNVPAVVVVPLRTPVDDRASPVGSVPDATDQV